LPVLFALVAALALLPRLATAQVFVAHLNGAQETPPNNSPATGLAVVHLTNPATGVITVDLTFSGLLAAQTAAHIHRAPPGVAGPVIVPLPLGSFTGFSAALTAADVSNLLFGNLYVNVHSTVFQAGEIRGQLIECTGPIISNTSSNPREIWPPNHKMVPVTVNYTVTDNCSSALACSLSVSSNEPVNGAGDGNTSPDWQVIDAHHVLLRAERAGPGNGRIYTITIHCQDEFGLSSNPTVTVTVPHDQGHH
jgi:hypothetical protein